MQECPSWLAFTLDNPLRRLIHKPKKLLAQFISEGQQVADIGCGPGVFSIAMAELVGSTGHVWAVDIQPAMLARVDRTAKRRGMNSRITLHRCEPTSLGLRKGLDFALLFWMLHEVPNPDRLLADVADLLKPGGQLLLVEPPFHVTKKQFEHEVSWAENAGLAKISAPAIRMCHVALFCRKNPASAPILS